MKVSYIGFLIIYFVLFRKLFTNKKVFGLHPNYNEVMFTQKSHVPKF